MLKSLISNKTKLFAFNTSTNLATHAVAVIVGFVTLPLKLDYFGVKLFGLFILVTSLANYVQKIDFGIGTTLQRYTAKLSTEDRHEEISRLLGFSLLFNFFYGLGIGVCMLVAGYYSDILFSLSEDSYLVFRQLTIVIAIRSVISCPLSIFTTFLTGRQLYFITNTLRLINVFANLLIIIFTIMFNWPILTYLICISVLGITTKCIATTYARYRFPFARPSRFRWSEIREYLPFSWHMIKSQLASLIQFETDRILIGIFLTPAALTFYHVGESLHGIIRQVYNNFTTSLMPLMAEKYAANDRDYIERAVYDGSRIISIMWYPIIITLMINTNYILSIWLGNQYAFLSLFASAFLLPYIINLPSSILSRVLVGSGKIKEYMNTRIIAALFNLLISIILIQYYGIWGVLAGTLCQSALFNIYFYRLYFKFIDIQFFRFFQKVIAPCFCVSAASIVSAGVLRSIWMPETILDLSIFLLVPVLSGYLIAALFNRQDISFLKRVVLNH